jgi:hypothetical protein
MHTKLNAGARQGWHAAAALTIALGGCAAKDPEVGANLPGNSKDSGADSDGGSGDDAASGALDTGISPASDASSTPPVTRIDGGSSACVNLQCRQRTCSGGGSTTVSGKVFDPAGKNPLYNVVVYVPNAPVKALTKGATCDSCQSLYSGSPIAATQTDAQGRFTLKNVPEGDDVPLVVQIGKWRRQLTLPKVTACTDNPQPDGMLRLPRNRKEGDIPNIAISTGEADTLECLLRRVGLDAAEYVPGASDQGSIHIFQGSRQNDNDAPNTMPPGPSSASALWNTKDSLMRFDILLLSCEGDETEGMNQQALHEYANAGGRVFASHFHYSWFNSGPFGSENLATWNPGSNHIDDIMGDLVTKLPDGRAFPKGEALAAWLANVGALQNGQLPIEEARNNARVGPTNTPSQAWITAAANSKAPGSTQYLSFNTPTTVTGTPDTPPPYCGRVVFSSLHVGAASGDEGDDPVPTGCANRDLSPQEKALEFMLFDLSSCVMEEDKPPEPPPVVILE